jgi:hypothetical protein
MAGTLAICVCASFFENAVVRTRAAAGVIACTADLDDNADGDDACL